MRHCTEIVQDPDGRRFEPHQAPAKALRPRTRRPRSPTTLNSETSLGEDANRLVVVELFLGELEADENLIIVWLGRSVRYQFDGTDVVGEIHRRCTFREAERDRTLRARADRL